MTDDDHLLPPLYRTVTDTPGWSTGTHISDEYGRICFKADHPHVGPALIAAKKQLHRGQVSVTVKIVSVALTHPQRTVIVCLGEEPDLGWAYAFDPRVLSNAGPPEVIRRSKRARNVPAFHVYPRECGAELSAVLAGRAAIPTPEPGGVVERQASLAEVGGA